MKDTVGRRVLKTIADLASALFLAIPFVCVAEAVIWQKDRTSLFGLLSWQLEVVMIDFFPALLGMLWLLIRYSDGLLRAHPWVNSWQFKLASPFIPMIPIAFFAVLYGIFRH